MGVTIDVSYLGDLHCEATHGPSGRHLRTDAPVDNGGRGAEFSPTDLVATAFATCVATMIGIAGQRDGIVVDGLQVRIVKEMTVQPPRRIAALVADVAMPAGLGPEARHRLETAAGACPVGRSLHPDVRLVCRFSYPD